MNERIKTMKKNYYDMLQINKNASPEIIEKAYKVLVKKYHPDLQTEENKKQAQEMLKEINEAYEILSTPEKKEDYDRFLQKQETTHQTNSPSSTTNQQSEEELLYWQKLHEEVEKEKLIHQQLLEQERQKAYYDAYLQDLRNRGYHIHYKKSLKDYIKGGICLFLTIFILFLLWQIPFIQNFFIDLFHTNPTLKTLTKFFTHP